MHINEAEMGLSEASVRVKEEYLDNSMNCQEREDSNSNIKGDVTSSDHDADDNIKEESPIHSPITSTTCSSELSADSGFMPSSRQTERSSSTSPQMTSAEKEASPLAPFSSDVKPRSLNLISCEDCGLVCAGQSHYQVHIRSHTGERPFKCTICGVAFTQKGNLRRHHKIHSDEKPFRCSICSYRCRRRDALNGHMKIHSDIRPYRCVHCARSYKSRQSLKEHEQQCSYKKNTSISPVSPFNSSRSPSASPQKNPSSLLLQEREPTFPTPLSLIPQSLINLAALSLHQTPKSASSSSGKRKASIPQKFTRYTDASIVNHEHVKASASVLPRANARAPLATSLYLMPSIISSMMQQRLEDDIQPNEHSEISQNEAVDFSIKRTSAKRPNHEDKVVIENSSDESNQQSPLSYASQRQLIDTKLSSRKSWMDEKRKSQSVNAFPSHDLEETNNERDHVTHRIPVKRNQDFLTSEREKLSGSARRKRPCCWKEREVAFGKRMVDFETPSINGAETSQHNDVTRFDSSPLTSCNQSKYHTKMKHFDEDRQAPVIGKSREATQFGLRIFSTKGEAGDVEEVKALYCPHCRCLFIDYVMFAIHAGCHGRRHPFECNVCGHLAADRYQFQSHITRGEHLVSTNSAGERRKSMMEFERDDVIEQGRSPIERRHLLDSFGVRAKASV